MRDRSIDIIAKTLNLEKDKIKSYLSSAVETYNTLDFIEHDPIQIPHRFSKKEDIEIAGFLSASIAWGNRKSILKNANRMMEIMENAPFQFLMDKYALHDNRHLIESFVHRTFNGSDLFFFLQSIQNIYAKHGGLEAVFNQGYQKDETIKSALIRFREVFLSIPHEKRVQKHLSNVATNSAAKRLNMYLRWMVRSDDNHVDFGIWKLIPMSALMLPLDVHTGNISRQMGLLSRKQNDWKAVEEITEVLRQFDKEDPIKYDFALFGLGVNP